mmetsp:Transcript_15415/g.22699  ORF Transcript_15415/g.22699 Transcript_15415/m.22699 type:complete len:208 (-) Transcript_15415:613-1236(-)|eukprot:CAMPEP_0195539806 /NCGR_PEP_ID=MMETSP0794_2-20130614/50250_1 /TAXON_ID=515487 /ORGANISM="Stephanopyxis turris, Strain CCMP 815" /LENGTH=207 /DNA_ID=CAMNT_0040673859 /DNA_START=107 /DNA_END=730 /DNA_ORIENTATION=-
MVQLTKGQIHGIIMMIGFGWLLPLGVLSARFMKHRSNDLWFQLHHTLQINGVVWGITGFCIAVKYFDVFHDGIGSTSYQHGCLGVLTFVLVLLQPLIAWKRPPPTIPVVHADEDEDTDADPSHSIGARNKRWWWEFVHKCIGYFALFLAFVTIWLGTKMEGPKWQLTYVLGVIGSLFLILGMMRFDRFSYQPPPSGAESEAEMQSIS